MRKLDFSRSRVARALGASTTAAAAVTGAGLVGNAPDAQASIVAWNINQVVPATNNGMYVKLDTQQFTTAPPNLSGYDLNIWNASLDFFPASDVPNRRSYIFGTTGPAALPVGTVVDANSAYGPVPNTTDNNGRAFLATTVENGWQLNATNYFGFRFYNDTTGQINYGFGEMWIVDSANRTLVNLYYENTGAAITITASGSGGGTVPEPGTLGYLVMGAAGLIARRQQQAAARRAANTV